MGDYLVKRKLRYQTALISILVILLTVLVSYTIYQRDQEWTKMQQIAAINSRCSNLQSALLQQIGMTEFVVGDSLTLYPSEDIAAPIKLCDLSKDNAVIGLYIDKSQCKTCYERALSFLTNSLQAEKQNKKVVILFSGFLPRDIQIIEKKCNIAYPVYLVERLNLKNDTFRFDQPFYFVVTRGGVLSYIFYPENMYEELGALYFKAVLNHYNRRAIVEKNQQVIQLDSMANLGVISLREKKRFQISMRNMSDAICRIKSIRPSCDCITVIDAPKELRPNTTDTISLEFLSTSIGTITRDVVVSVEGDTTVHLCRITANVRLQKY